MAVPALLLVAHGTRSELGSASSSRLVAAVADARPQVRVGMCFLDVAEPCLADALAARSGATVLVPMLLSTGYHVETDIPAAVSGVADVRVARHLGPHPLLTEVLVERLVAIGRASKSTVLVGAGSTQADAAAELARAGELLSGVVERHVAVHTMADDLRAALQAQEPPVEVATYLLAEGQFFDALRSAAEGIAAVAEPLGVHPAMVELIWSRYDAVAAGD